MNDAFSRITGLTEIVDPIPRPAAIPRPSLGGARPRARQAPVQRPGIDDGSGQEADPLAADSGGDAFGRIAGLDKLDPPPAPEQPKESWGEWIKNAIVGRRDPNERATQSVYQQFPKELSNPTGLAALGGANDAAMGDIVQKALGDKFIRREKDANGYDVFVTRGPDGQEQRGYLNQPGLDREDVARAIRGGLPYAAVALGLGPLVGEAGVGLQAIAQGTGAGLTSIGGDIVNSVQGSKQGIDPIKAGIMMGFGAAGPALSAAGSAVWRRFVTEPSLIDKATGTLTQKGIDALKEAGVDPQDITPDFAKAFVASLARNGNPAEAATSAGISRFGIPATRGQVTKDPYLLTQEEGMRRRLYGEAAQDTMLGFDKEQQAAIKRSALGDDSLSYRGNGGNFAPSQGIGEQLNPTRQPGAFPSDTNPATLGNSIGDSVRAAREAARQQESNLWDSSIKDLGASDTALGNLRPHMEAALADETAFTPTGEKMASAIGDFAEGKLPAAEAGGIQLKQIQSVDAMRRHLGRMVGAAEEGSDRQQAGKIYDAFNDWIADSAKQRLLLGEPAAAMQLIKARAFTKDVRELFEPRAQGGRLSPGGQRLGKILDPAKADSGEGVVQSLFGSQGSRGLNDGTVQALSNIKQALARFGGQNGAQAWNDIRLAYWSRLVTGKNGELVGPTAMMNNIKAAMRGQSSAMNLLYEPTELRQMREFVRALEVVSYKPPNASGSGYTAASFAKEGILRLLDAFGLGTPARMVFERTGIGNAWNAALAKQAIRSLPRPARPNLTPIVTGAGQAYRRAQDGGR